MTVVATGYCGCAICCDGDGKTATGRDANLPGVAVDPDIIPLGSRLDVPGYGSWRLADDTGRLIKGGRVDLRFPTHAEARAYGKRTIRVRVWTKE
jgi:3D (Asp-Asp-Asp) domain-containing protein